MNNVFLQKTKMRKTLKVLRAKISEKERKQKSRDIVEKFYANIPVEKKQIIAGFIPMENEPEINLLLEMYRDNGNKICLPVVTNIDEPMSFRQYDIGDELVENKRFKFLEPKADKASLIPNIIIIPFLGFDNNGYRIGYGGGFYDRTLRMLYSVGEIVTVGIGFDCQKVTKLPIEKYDEKLDAVVTEKNDYVFEQ